MKIAVYAVSKNESKNVNAFMDSVDAIGLPVYVLDHSTDGTAEMLRKRGAIVDTTPMDPFWFDAGKNHALSLVPDHFDWVINADLDERFNPVLKDALSLIDEDATRLRYLYQPDNDIKRVRFDLRIHRRVGYKFCWPIHEYLMPEPDFVEKVQDIDDVLITQYPDRARKHTWVGKLAKAVDSFPEDSRLRMLYGRDLYFDGSFVTSLKEFEKFVSMDVLPFDRSYAYTMMARCHKKFGDAKRELANLINAVKECRRKESCVELAHAYMLRGKYAEALGTAQMAFEIYEGQYSPHSDPGAWTFKPYEIAMISAYNLGMIELAKNIGEKALSHACEVEDVTRIKANLDQIKETVQ